TLSEAEALKAPDVGCIVSPQQQTVDQAFKSPAFSRTRVVVIPETLFANIHAGDLPFYTGGNRPFGGNIIYSSGTTGAFKKMMMGGSNEAARNQARAKALFLNERTVYHCMEYALWAGLGFKNPAAVWHVGGCVVFDRRPDRFNYFFQHGMNCSHLTPPHLKELLRCTSAAPH